MQVTVWRNGQQEAKMSWMLAHQNGCSFLLSFFPKKKAEMEKKTVCACCTAKSCNASLCGSLLRI
jgi:hypothetical protein